MGRPASSGAGRQPVVAAARVGAASVALEQVQGNEKSFLETVKTHTLTLTGHN